MDHVTMQDPRSAASAARAPARRADDAAPISFPVVLADIGGTNARFAILADAHSPMRRFPTVHTADYPDLPTALEAAVLSRIGLAPRSLLVALAGPVGDAGAKLTNALWTISATALCEAIRLDTVVLFNDFEALAMALPSLESADLVGLGGGPSLPREPRVVIGPGTGLGVAALVYGAGSFRPIAGEGGHVSLAPETARELALWPHIDRPDGRISAETVLSGSGLGRLHRGLCALEGRTDGCADGPSVTAAAEAGDPLASEAIDLFLTILGRVAGDLALIFLARGGVFVSGGICPRYGDRLAAGGFRRAFEAKAPHQALLTEMPTFLVVDDAPALKGLASFATVPSRFALDFTRRRVDR